MKIIVLAVLLLTVVMAGCRGDDGGKRTSARSTPTTDNRPVSPREWKAVINDSLSGGIDHPHRCAALREALRHIPPDLAYHPNVREDVEKYDHDRCPIRLGG